MKHSIERKKSADDARKQRYDNSTRVVNELNVYAVEYLGYLPGFDFGKYLHAVDKYSKRKTTAYVDRSGLIFVGDDAWRRGWGDLCDYRFKVYRNTNQFLKDYIPCYAPYSLPENESKNAFARRCMG